MSFINILWELERSRESIKWGGGDQGAWDRELFAVNDNLPGDTGILSEALLVGFSASVLQLEKWGSERGRGRTEVEGDEKGKRKTDLYPPPRPLGARPPFSTYGKCDRIKQEATRAGDQDGQELSFGHSEKGWETPAPRSWLRTGIF